MGDRLSLKRLFLSAFDHRRLYDDQFDRDPNLRQGIFESYQLSDFVPFLKGGKPVMARNVRATWYADERNGTEWHGRLTATETQFNTYAFDVALNKSYRHRFPLGSYIKVLRQIEGEEKPREIIVRVTDVKGGRASISPRRLPITSVFRVRRR